MDVKVAWNCAMLFTASTPDKTSIMLDTDPAHGGVRAGPMPMEALLMALGGCTGMDVISTLQKMRAPVDHFSVEVHGDRAGGHPQVFTSIHLRYVISGKGLTAEQVNNAVARSQGRDSSVSAMLRKAAPVTYEIVVEDAAADARPARAGSAATVGERAAIGPRGG